MEIKITDDDGRKIAQIKELRNIFNSDLKETKEFVELLLSLPSGQSTIPDSIFGGIDKHEAVDKISRSKYYRVIYNFPAEIKQLTVAAIYLGEFHTAKLLMEVLESI